jgi:hypothetical protein
LHDFPVNAIIFNEIQIFMAFDIFDLEMHIIN